MVLVTVVVVTVLMFVEELAKIDLQEDILMLEVLTLASLIFKMTI